MYPKPGFWIPVPSPVPPPSLSEDYTNDGHKDPDHKHETLGQSLFKKVSRSITDDFSLPLPLFLLPALICRRHNIILIFCQCCHTHYGLFCIVKENEKKCHFVALKNGQLFLNF